MNTVIVTAAIASLLTAVPAVAEPKPAADMSDTVKATKPAKPTRYCFVDTVTGTRIPVRECKTRADWARQGIEIPATM